MLESQSVLSPAETAAASDEASYSATGRKGELFSRSTRGNEEPFTEEDQTLMAVMESDSASSAASVKSELIQYAKSPVVPGRRLPSGSELTKLLWLIDTMDTDFALCSVVPGISLSLSRYSQRIFMSSRSGSSFISLRHITVVGGVSLFTAGQT